MIWSEINSNFAQIDQYSGTLCKLKEAKRQEQNNNSNKRYSFIKFNCYLLCFLSTTFHSAFCSYRSLLSNCSQRVLNYK